MILTKLNTIVHNKSVLSYLLQQKVGVIIDELDASTILDKSLVTILKSDILPYLKHHPVILICNHKSSIKKLIHSLFIIQIPLLNKKQFSYYISKQFLSHFDFHIDCELLNIIYTIIPPYFANIDELITIIKSNIKNTKTKITKHHIVRILNIYTGENDLESIPLTKEEQITYIAENSKQLHHDKKAQVIALDPKYFSQTIFENIISTAPIYTLDTFILSNKIDFKIHNEQLWNLHQYSSYINTELLNFIEVKNIITVPKIYSKISQFLYQKKTFNEVQKYFNIFNVQPELVSILILGLCKNNEVVRKNIPHKIKNSLRRIGIMKDYWKSIMRKWR